MNNLEKLQLIEEMVSLRRKVMNLNEIDNQPMVNNVAFNQQKDSAGRIQDANFDAQNQNNMAVDPQLAQQNINRGVASNYAQPQRFKPQNPFSNKIGMQRVAGDIKENESCSSESMDETVGAGRSSETAMDGSRTGLDESRACDCGEANCAVCNKLKEENFGASNAEHGQDAQHSSDRKRGHEMDPKLEESLNSYYKIAGLIQRRR